MNSFELARYRAGLSVKDAAESAKVSERTIARIENDGDKPSAPVAAALAKTYKVTVDELFGLEAAA